MPASIRDERGFTLIELLVVILIIGVLAAIALPNFLSQREKGQDARAKADARSLVTQVESCYVNDQTYTPCTTGTFAGGGLDVGSAPGQVEVSVTPSSYVVTAHSLSGGDFMIAKSTTTPYARSCSGSSAGCNGGSW